MTIKDIIKIINKIHSLTGPPPFSIFNYRPIIAPDQLSFSQEMKIIIAFLLHLTFLVIFLFVAYVLLGWVENNVGTSFASVWRFLYFNVFPPTIIFLSLLVFLLRNPIYALVSLIILFLAAALFLLSIGVEFLAMIYLIIYIGAIAILFLFVIMMFNLRDLQNISPKIQDSDFLSISFFIYLFIILKFYNLLLFTFLHYQDDRYYLHQLDFTNYFIPNSWNEIYYRYFLQYLVTFVNKDSVPDYSLNDLPDTFFVDFVKVQDIWIFSNTFYTYHSYLFILASILLLSSMIGAIVLALSTTEASFLQKNNKNE